MLDNWTREQFFSEILASSFEEFSGYEGRIAIIDDPHLEKTYDQFVQSLTELNYLFNEWSNNVHP